MRISITNNGMAWHGMARGMAALKITKWHGAHGAHSFCWHIVLTTIGWKIMVNEENEDGRQEDRIMLKAEGNRAIAFQISLYQHEHAHYMLFLRIPHSACSTLLRALFSLASLV